MHPTTDALALARDVAGRAEAVEGVAALDGGVAGAFATYRRGERVVGVRIDTDDTPTRTTVRVRADGLDALPGLGERVRAAVAATPGLEGGAVDVHVSDVVVPGELPPQQPPSHSPPSPSHDDDATDRE